jgi:hypothetical protein
MSAFDPALHAHAARVSSIDDENVFARMTTWGMLADEWARNPVHGSLGWYYASKELDAFGHGETASSHSFYLRTLAEVGALGLLSVLLLPVFAVVNGIKLRFLAIDAMGDTAKFRSLAAGVLALIVSLFMREATEDGYLTEFISPVTAMTVLGIAILGLCHRGASSHQSGH